MPELKNPFKKTPPGAEPHELTKSILERQKQINLSTTGNKSDAVKSALKGMKEEEKQKLYGELRKQVDENIIKLLEGGAESYVEWTTAMSRMVGYLKVLNQAFATWLTNVNMSNPNWDKLNSDKLVVAPNVSYHVGMDEETGQIKTNLYHNDKAVSRADKNAFDALLQGWAKKNNYTIQQDPTDPTSYLLKNDTTGNIVRDKTVFDALKKDAANGLHTFLSDKLALTLQEEETARPPAPAP